MTLRIGLIGAARITPPVIIMQAKAEGSGCEARAIAARDPARAKEFAEKHGVPIVSESYEALFTRDDIDLIYIATPPTNHAELARAALAAGKHVLVEKPFSVCAEETARTIEAAKKAGRRLFEASHYHFHPTSRRLIEAVRGGALGRILSVEAWFNTPVERTSAEFRWDARFGGGCLRDIGYYPLHFTRWIAGAEPTDIVVISRLDTPEGVDAALAATFSFPGGVAAKISCDMRADCQRGAEGVVVGEKGRAVFRYFQHPMFGGLTIETEADVEEIASHQSLTFQHQLAAVRDAIASGAPLLNEGDDILGQARALDALYAAKPLARSYMT